MSDADKALKIRPVQKDIDECEKRITQYQTSKDLKTPLVEKLPKNSVYTQHFLKKHQSCLLQASVDSEISERRAKLSYVDPRKAQPIMLKKFRC